MSTSTASQHLPAAATTRPRRRTSAARTGTSRTGASRTGASRTGASRTGTSRTGASRTATGRAVGRTETGRAVAGTATSRTRGHVRLTRRGRLLVLVALVGVLFAAFSLGRSASQAAPRVDAPAAAAVPAAPQQLTVQHGESLWTLAQRIAPDDDPRDVVAQLRQINDLSSSSVRPGQQLLLPRAA